MKCPHCDQEIPGTPCRVCGITVPEEAHYCLGCGTMTDSRSQDDEDKDDFDFENRILCPDGVCTGIIVDGKCIECGKAYKGR